MLLATKNNLTGLGEAAKSVSDDRLRQYVNKLQSQEGGKDPNHHKINGNMAWHNRKQPSDHPMNAYFDSLGRDGKKVLADLKNRVPDAFNEVTTSPGNQQQTGNTNGSKAEETQSPPLVRPAASGFMSRIKNTDPKVWYVVGGGFATLTVIAILVK